MRLHPEIHGVSPALHLSLGYRGPVLPKLSPERSANGGPPGPVWQYAVDIRQAGPGVLPLSPAWLER